MTTLPQIGLYHGILSRIKQVGVYWRLVTWGEGVALGVGVALTGVLLATGVQGFAALPPGLWRVALLAIMLGGWLAAAGGLVLSVMRRRNTRQVARHIEAAMPALDNGLINAIQLTRDPANRDPRLVVRALQEIDANVRKHDLRRAIDLRRLRNLGFFGGGALALLLAYALLFGPRLAHAWGDLWAPYVDHGRIGVVRILDVTPGDVTLPYGKALTVEARLAKPLGDRRAHLERRLAGETRELPMSVIGGGERLSLVLGRIDEPFEYRLHAGDATSRWFRVSLKRYVYFERFDTLYHYPSYTRLDDRLVENSPGDLRAVAGSTATLIVRCQDPVFRGELVFRDGRRVVMTRKGGGTRFEGRITFDREQFYQVQLRDEQNRLLHRVVPEDVTTAIRTTAKGDPLPADYFRILPTADNAPTVKLTFPGKPITAYAGGNVQIIFKAGDDYGISTARLYLRRGALSAAAKLAEWTGEKLTDPKSTLIRYRLELDAEAVKPGDVLTYFVEVRDTFPITDAGGETGQRTRSSALTISVIDRDAVIQAKLDRLRRLKKKVAAILAIQKRASRDAGALVGRPLDEITQAGGTLRLAQSRVRADTQAVVLDETLFDEDSRLIQRTLAALARDDMTRAILGCEPIANLGSIAALAGPFKGLTGVQDTIIKVLETILEIMPRLKKKALDEPLSDPGFDMPPDHQAKLDQLRKKLKEFIEAQRKVVNATKDLAKKPVDDYTEDDLKKLEALKAAEDDFLKFLNEMHKDLSKMAEQDFSNPAALEEIVEIKTEVQMAKDALAKKAVEIAVPHEEAGLEKAEELQTNLEKWLPDTPDRDKWSMEEPAGGEEDIPMAELPKELEDLVGDLMENEEDLFDDIEDTTSKWTDSLDKGAGWDTMDGPISNMSARGVTGNRLPNSSEISGRSGEGRQGKSAGEFVEKEAHGKGGRRTPSQLRPHPFQKGEVKDTSKEGLGGATGGGKVSGGGSEGLEGPVPAQMKRDMERLKNRQAQLRNQAEKINLKFKVGNYENFKLEQVIRLMRRNERDLRDMRYRTALRRKKLILGNLDAQKRLLSGQIEVQTDARTGPGKEVRDELISTNRTPPKGFEEFLRRYYSKLNKTRDTESPATPGPVGPLPE